MTAGPMITAGVVIAKDPEARLEQRHLPLHCEGEGANRIGYRDANNMRLFADAPIAPGRPLPISISIGTHPLEIMASAIARLWASTRCTSRGLCAERRRACAVPTIDVPSSPTPKIVLEAEILPRAGLARRPLRPSSRD